ncbi:MAG: hypothetical protein ACI4I7_02590 [Oscillospiraceae bacterium]
MGITQLGFIKSLPFIISNIFSLFTVIPLAIVVLAIGALIPGLFKNRFLNGVGVVSYEIFLVHAFTLNLLESDLLHILLFVFVTSVLAYLLHLFVSLKNIFIKNQRELNG